MKLDDRVWPGIAFAASMLLVLGSSTTGFADDDENQKNDNQAKADKKNKDPQDLEIKYLGTGATDQVLRFVVTNKGDDDAPSTTAKVVTLSPPPPAERPYTVPKLDGGESFDFTYTLSAPCNSHRVRASVPVLSNDSNPGNNDVEVDVCGPARQAPQGSAANAIGGVNQSGPGTETDVNTNPITSTLGAARQTGQVDAVVVPPVPENLRVGEHVLNIPVHDWRVVKRTYRSGVFYLCDGSGPPTLGTVGFAHANFDDLNDCQVNSVYQTVMAFDLSELRSIYGKLVLGTATLTWDDTKTLRPNEVVARQLDGSDRSCVDALGRPTVDWRAYDGLIPNEYVNDGNRSAVWDVHGLVIDWLRDPDLEARGVLLKGYDESLDPDDDNDCFSYVKNPRLELTYTVAP